jgi:hypothetical protein
MSGARTLATLAAAAVYVEDTPARTQSRGPATSSDGATRSARASSPMKIKCAAGYARTVSLDDAELRRLGPSSRSQVPWSRPKLSADRPEQSRLIYVVGARVACFCAEAAQPRPPNAPSRLCSDNRRWREGALASPPGGVAGPGHRRDNRRRCCSGGTRRRSDAPKATP